MAVPSVVILGVLLWIMFSAFKYWYISRTKINYTHKLDDKVLEDIRTPNPRAFELASKRKREQVFVDEPEGFPFQNPNSPSPEPTAAGEKEKNANDDEKPKKESTTKRPLTIFEEIDLMQKQRKEKPLKSGKYDKSMFDDVLSRLHRDIQHERKSSSATKKE